MRIKTNELKGAALDWAVAKATGMHVRVDIWAVNGLHWPYDDSISSSYSKRISPSSDWSQGGPLIEEYGVRFLSHGDEYVAIPKKGDGNVYSAPGHLTSAMRAIVASELGDEVDIPEELP